jgi:hypothetical protein
MMGLLDRRKAGNSTWRLATDGLSEAGGKAVVAGDGTSMEIATGGDAAGMPGCTVDVATAPLLVPAALAAGASVTFALGGVLAGVGADVAFTSLGELAVAAAAVAAAGGASVFLVDVAAGSELIGAAIDFRTGKGGGPVRRAPFSSLAPPAVAGGTIDWRAMTADSASRARCAISAENSTVVRACFSGADCERVLGTLESLEELDAIDGDEAFSCFSLGTAVGVAVPDAGWVPTEYWASRCRPGRSSSGGIPLPNRVGNEDSDPTFAAPEPERVAGGKLGSERRGTGGRACPRFAELSVAGCRDAE